jgi:hypothetical protein
MDRRQGRGRSWTWRWVANLDATVERLAAQRARFRGEIVEGPGGRQILIKAAAPATASRARHADSRIQWSTPSNSSSLRARKRAARFPQAASPRCPETSLYPKAATAASPSRRPARRYGGPAGLPRRDHARAATRRNGHRHRPVHRRGAELPGGAGAGGLTSVTSARRVFAETATTLADDGRVSRATCPRFRNRVRRRRPSRGGRDARSGRAATARPRPASTTATLR